MLIVSDDWCLEKIKYNPDYPFNSKKYDIYYKGDIEAFRKKLVKDFCKGYKFNYSIKDIINIINKRFGVDKRR